MNTSISIATLRLLRAAIHPPKNDFRRCMSTHMIFRQSRKSSANASTHTRQLYTPSKNRRASTSSAPPPQSLDALLQKQSASHYDFFPESVPQGAPPNGTFDIDLSALKREFLRLQALAHPDRLPPERRGAAQGLSARINEAYKTLQSPLRRAEYLLELRGARAQADEEHVLGEAEGDSEILLEVMEAREEAEEAESEEQISKLRAENDERMQSVSDRLAQAFATDDLLSAKREAVRLRYWIGVEDRLREGNGNH